MNSARPLRTVSKPGCQPLPNQTHTHAHFAHGRFKAKTGKWKKCKTSPKTLKTADEVKQSILDCALGKKKKKKAKGKQAEAPPKEEL